MNIKSSVVLEKHPQLRDKSNKGGFWGFKTDNFCICELEKTISHYRTRNSPKKKILMPNLGYNTDFIELQNYQYQSDHVQNINSIPYYNENSSQFSLANNTQETRDLTYFDRYGNMPVLYPQSRQIQQIHGPILPWFYQ